MCDAPIAPRSSTGRSCGTTDEEADYHNDEARRHLDVTLSAMQLPDGTIVPWAVALPRLTPDALDKLGVTGSSPVPPISSNPCKRRSPLPDSASKWLGTFLHAHGLERSEARLCRDPLVLQSCRLLSSCRLF
jgi:hypothetical protein